MMEKDVFEAIGDNMRFYKMFEYAASDQRPKETSTWCVEGWIPNYMLKVRPLLMPHVAHLIVEFTQQFLYPLYIHYAL